jgi:hypothetical protein
MLLGNRLLYSGTLNSLLILGWHNVLIMGQATTATAGIGHSSVSDSMRLKRRDGLWLAMALLLHAILLLIPLQHLPSATELSRVLSVSLQAPRKEQLLVEPQEVPVLQAEKTKPAKEPPPRPLQPLAEPPAVPAPRAGENDRGEPLVKSTTARLIDSASRLKWSLSEFDESRQLGVFVPPAGPKSQRPGIVVEDNLFNGMVIPARTEIVDRWLAADGSHNVVLNTSSGETLCGRAQPWNPMSPLIEPIMTFWKCGGGGSRTFKMPDRYMRSRQDREMENAGGNR